MMGMKVSWFFPPFFSLETSVPHRRRKTRQDSPVRLGIMDFLPFSFEAAGVVPFVGGDLACFHQKLDPCLGGIMRKSTWWESMILFQL